MTVDLVTRAAALIAVLGTAVVYGTDVFCAIVLRPALTLWLRSWEACIDTETGVCRRPGCSGSSPPRQAWY